MMRWKLFSIYYTKNRFPYYTITRNKKGQQNVAKAGNGSQNRRYK